MAKTILQNNDQMALWVWLAYLVLTVDELSTYTFWNTSKTPNPAVAPSYYYDDDDDVPK